MTQSSSSIGGMRRKPRQARSQERVYRIIDVAEELFIAQGYDATTTNAIAARAQIPIGSLYQFFPDKTAIMQALAARHEERLHQRLAVLDNPDLVELPLSILVDQFIDITQQHFSENPGYFAIFMQLQGEIPELKAVEDVADAQLIRDLATLLAQREPGLETADYEAIAFVLTKAISTLMWLSLSQEQPFRQRLVAEMKRFTLSYLQSYFSSSK
ncbi:TetR/AcrR family transcriptional regulator [Aetokthonos hydrillicola Thurmond2011]|jgi:AcrR family transcriptional regulator|uniref:TetR/AcrR family transcriptional regulator n=1 Tax=Aetokthonos hydrillicola Thurmond2011 TaxID=2712845 RepID=A0AAP5MBE2_9CYAN|nr:TetR/AcrR family transcriptional regulator [Aetokthonos hydrillicola]MBO3458677.1 TetR/AcrR family transcriptional regulator [Aetokthonos hydrillicola CCALA 1050]MBW4588030.1 TetR/AcrR family transcriptional regulator [Aetokthonos hydrillicola CCALA 1050]MDR9897018.1 TetR/AcrR family transcriptional regulator [Aetokthonos hydrillicola Thurmond2011]